MYRLQLSYRSKLHRALAIQHVNDPALVAFLPFLPLPSPSVPFPVRHGRSRGDPRGTVGRLIMLSCVLADSVRFVVEQSKVTIRDMRGRAIRFTRTARNESGMWNRDCILLPTKCSVLRSRMRRNSGGSQGSVRPSPNGYDPCLALPHCTIFDLHPQPDP